VLLQIVHIAYWRWMHSFLYDTPNFVIHHSWLFGGTVLDRWNVASLEPENPLQTITFSKWTFLYCKVLCQHFCQILSKSVIENQTNYRENKKGVKFFETQCIWPRYLCLQPISTKYMYSCRSIWRSLDCAHDQLTLEVTGPTCSGQFSSFSLVRCERGFAV